MTENIQSERVLGARSNPANVVTKHLFVISPNNSGSTFITRALAQCNAVWSLPREGQHMLGYVGPDTIAEGISLNWAATQKRVNFVQDPSGYDWTKTKKAWYFQATARQHNANIFLEKTPSFLLITDQLARYFTNPQFIFLVRNPYAAIEGILRRRVDKAVDREVILKDAAQHMMACFSNQKNNISSFPANSAFFSYEEVCANPDLVGNKVQQILPELADLEFDRRLPVKGMYNEQLRNMNQDQISRLSGADIDAINSILRGNVDLMEFFGYEIL